MDTPTLTWTCTNCDQLERELEEAKVGNMQLRDALKARHAWVDVDKLREAVASAKGIGK
jgi:hypothetical protein